MSVPEITVESLQRIATYVGTDPTWATFAEALAYVKLVSAPFGPLDDAQWQHLTEHSVGQRSDGRWGFLYDPAIAAPFKAAFSGQPIDLWPIYERIACPTLVVRGAESDLLTRDTWQRMGERGPRAQLAEIPGVGHAPMFLADDQIAAGARLPARGVKHVEVGGLRLEYVDHPAHREGRPVILMLHEGLGSVSMWRHFPERVAAVTGCRTIAWSRAGYGHSQPYGEPRTARYMHREALAALPALLAALAIERPLLFGHSDGGSIALIFAGAFPDVPLGVVALAPHEFVEDETLAGILAAREAWTATDLPAKLARHHHDAARVFAEWNAIWLSPEFRAWNIEDCLPEIRCPVLAIQGEDDEYATMRQIDVIAERVADATLLKLPACGHSPHRDQPAAVLGALDAFVRRLSGS